MCFNVTNYYRSSQRYRTEVKRVTYIGPSKHRHNLVYIIMSTFPRIFGPRHLSAEIGSAEFEPRNLSAEFVVSRGIPRNLRFFHSNSYFFTENDLKVALLQVCL